MKTLVLMPRPRRLEYVFLGPEDRSAPPESHLSVLPSSEDAMVDALRAIKSECQSLDAAPGLVVIRSAYGGARFARTCQVDAETLSQFATLAAEAPMHVPPVHLLAQAALRAFAGAAVVMAFETAFFVDLPTRERRYGIADDRVRRFGYHGLYHQAASMERDGLRESRSARTLSLCLEPQPEIAAIIGHRPVMVTSGATPLEGLPGETTCGEIDPTIILTMARNLLWGPEQINDVLTRHSGLRGLLGRSARLDEVLDWAAWSAKGAGLPQAAEGSVGAARNLFAYRVLLAAGAAVAAMGGVDRIVLTGRYANSGRGMGRWLARRLRSAEAGTKRPRVVLCATPLSRLLADQGVAAISAGWPLLGKAS